VCHSESPPIPSLAHESRRISRTDVTNSHDLAAGIPAKHRRSWVGIVVATCLGVHMTAAAVTLRGVALGVASLAVLGQARVIGDPLEFLVPGMWLSASDLKKLDAGKTWVDILPAHGHEVAIVATTRINADAERLIAWVREIELMQRGRYVQAIGRFSPTPRIEDLALLVLEDRDLEDIRKCRPGKCGVKLSAAEIVGLRAVATSAGSGWKAAVQQAFREVVLARARQYLTEGHSAAIYDDRSRTVRLDAEFAAILDRSAFLHARLPRLREYLAAFPREEDAEVESFLYWSKDTIAGRPLISVTHVSVVRSDGVSAPEVLVAAKQVFATHYLTGSLALTSVSRVGDGTSRYLTYLNRSRVDLLGGAWGGLFRSILERRVRDEAPAVLDGLRQRLESGDPVRDDP
jgi:hypothetical protein